MPNTIFFFFPRLPQGGATAARLDLGNEPEPGGRVRAPLFVFGKTLAKVVSIRAPKLPDEEAHERLLRLSRRRSA